MGKRVIERAVILPQTEFFCDVCLEPFPLSGSSGRPCDVCSVRSTHFEEGTQCGQYLLIELQEEPLLWVCQFCSLTMAKPREHLQRLEQEMERTLERWRQASALFAEEQLQRC